jgi:hypothetical protein
MGNARFLSHEIIFSLFLSYVLRAWGGEGRKEDGDPKKLEVN